MGVYVQFFGVILLFVVVCCFSEGRWRSLDGEQPHTSHLTSIIASISHLETRDD